MIIAGIWFCKKAAANLWHCLCSSRLLEFQIMFCGCRDGPWW